LASPRTPDYILKAQADWEGLATVEVISTSCGQDNAAYYPSLNMVEMCTELYDRPELAVAIFNHEMGHAFMFQRGIPNSERGADELSMLMSTPDQLTAAAKWFLDMSREEGPSSGDDGEHQAHLDRAAALLCYLDGTDPDPVQRSCRMYAESVNENWARMLIMTQD
jgi:hypothetical protein